MKEFTELTLKTGTILFDSDAVEVAADSYRQESDYACVICDVDGEMKPILLFSDNPIAGGDWATEEALLAECAKEFPQAAALLEKEIAPVMENGRQVNELAWMDAQRLRVYAVPTIKNREELGREDAFMHCAGILRD